MKYKTHSGHKQGKSKSGIHLEVIHTHSMSYIEMLFLLQAIRPPIVTIEVSAKDRCFSGRCASQPSKPQRGSTRECPLPNNILRYWTAIAYAALGPHPR